MKSSTCSFFLFFPGRKQRQSNYQLRKGKRLKEEEEKKRKKKVLFRKDHLTILQEFLFNLDTFYRNLNDIDIEVSISISPVIEIKRNCFSH